MLFKIEKEGYDCTGFAWFGATINGEYVAYHALDSEHAMKMHQQTILVNMRRRIKSYAEEDDDLKLLDWDNMSDDDIKYYFNKYINDGSGMGHL